jgi:hypothetical protein
MSTRDSDSEKPAEIGGPLASRNSVHTSPRGSLYKAEGIVLNIGSAHPVTDLSRAADSME